MKIKSNQTHAGFSFRSVNYEDVLAEFKNLDMSKTIQLDGSPTKIVIQNLNVFFSKLLVKDINTYIKKAEFSDKLKTANVKRVTNMKNQISTLMHTSNTVQNL